MSYFNKAKNRKERMKFVELWAEYVRTHPDKDWSSQQKVLIDSQMQGAKKQYISVKEYLEIKNMSKR